MKYPGDDAPKAALARWLASEALEAGLPPELPVMAALVESGLANLRHPESDAAGFFQMRISIWNRGEYAGFPRKPKLQVNWFAHQALAIQELRRRADPAFGDDPGDWGEWIADVERPAEHLRGRYQLRLEEARRLVARRG
jgi:hypothetical protein